MNADADADADLARILVIDDFFGRSHADRRNDNRANLCAQYLLRDVTEDEDGLGGGQEVLKPIADAAFFRGQRPACSTVGDTVENDLAGCLRVIERGWRAHGGERVWSMVLLDLCFYTGRVTVESDRKATGMPEGRSGDDDPQRYFGLTILRTIQEQFPGLPVVILSSKPRDSVSRQFSEAGALAFLDRSDASSPELLEDYLWRYGLIPDAAGEIVGRSKALLTVLRSARQAAAHTRNVLLRGPRGSGKELLARYLHRQSQVGKERQIVVVDAGALSAQLYASELFGHRRGSFTGADRNREGRIVQADGGDLFLDEIGNMPAEVQAGLLRVLEYRKVTPIGGNAPRAVDVRFVSATNEDLEQKAMEGGFRLDLLDRLREGGTLVLPPLRERKEDIPLLITQFVREAEAASPRAMSRDIAPEVVRLLQGHDWPGNVRELRQCVLGAINRNPDVEHLVPSHVELPGASASMSVVPVTPRLEHPPVFHEAGVDLESLLGQLRAFDFSGVSRNSLEGRLQYLEQVCTEFIANYLSAILEATRKPVVRKVQIHPAVKMATGNDKLSASKAADIIKRLLKGAQPIEDPTLRAALEVAQRLRPSRNKASTSRR